MDSRAAILKPGRTDAVRLVHGAADGKPGVYLERLGDYLLLQSERDPGAELLKFINAELVRQACRGVYFKLLRRQIRKTEVGDASPRLLAGEAAPEQFEIRENGVRYEASFREGYSYGLFLDQRENRARIRRPDGLSLPPTATAPRLLNAFAYTCAFSVCGGLAGFDTTSLDLSRKYLDWGRRNFELNGIDADGHDFIYGDVFDWFRRFHNKGRKFEVIVLDPPTFSKSKKRQFKAERDYGELVAMALPILAPGGVLFVSTNAARLSVSRFQRHCSDAVVTAGRRVLEEEFVGQPADFPVALDEPAYLKTMWLRVA